MSADTLQLALGCNVKQGWITRHGLHTPAAAPALQLCTALALEQPDAGRLTPAEPHWSVCWLVRTCLWHCLRAPCSS